MKLPHEVKRSGIARNVHGADEGLVDEGHL